MGPSLAAVRAARLSAENISTTNDALVLTQSRPCESTISADRWTSHVGGSVPRRRCVFSTRALHW
eukprot:225841-Prymnesium_polylepis.1